MGQIAPKAELELKVKGPAGTILRRSAADFTAGYHSIPGLAVLLGSPTGTKRVVISRPRPVNSTECQAPTNVCLPAGQVRVKHCLIRIGQPDTKGPAPRDRKGVGEHPVPPTVRSSQRPAGLLHRGSGPTHTVQEGKATARNQDPERRPAQQVPAPREASKFRVLAPRGVARLWAWLHQGRSLAWREAGRGWD